MLKSKFQKGNVILIVLALVAVIGVGGYYLYNQVGSNSSVMQNDYAFGTGTPSTNTASVEGTTANSLTTSTKMTLAVTTPLTGAVLKSKVITLTGKTSANAEVFVNDKSTKADANGNFSLVVTLDEGENSLVVTANDSDGNVAEQTLSVNVQTF